MLRTVLWFFVGGLLVAMALELSWWAVGYYSHTGYLFERLSLFFWPSSIFKMALGDRVPRFQTVLVYALSFVANGVLYGIIGLLFALARNALMRQR